mgnify:CR=1 FL=1
MPLKTSVETRKSQSKQRRKSLLALSCTFTSRLNAVATEIPSFQLYPLHVLRALTAKFRMTRLADPTEPHGKVFRPRKHEIEEKRFSSYDDLLWDLRIG